MVTQLDIGPPRAPHADHSARLLAHAQEMIGKGDRLQASEKIWGAVAHKMKEIARGRGWGWRRHRGFESFAQYLRAQTDTLEIATLTRSLGRFHSNFYDDTLTDEELLDGLAEAKTLIGLLEDADKKLPEGASLPQGLRPIREGPAARRPRSRE